ncbi:MAG: hypothetical protein JEY94_00800 [Melioribacteraceae bacterium]|nr:hypothetical protein [Melioribacteraceae bacterium]
MIKRILVLIIIVSSFNLYSQEYPATFKLGEKSLKKSDDKSPIGNSIGDIAIGNGMIWASTGQGLTMTNDGGNTWQNFPLSNFGNNKIYSMGYHEDIIWVGVGKKNSDDVDVGGGIWFSQNNGENWTNIPQPVDDPGDSSIIYGINNMRALPVTVPQQNVIWDISFTSDEIWIASWAAGIRKCKTSELISNPTMSWDRVILPSDNLNSISPNDVLTFSLQVQSGKFGPEAYLNHLGFSVDAVNDNEIFAGTAGGLNRSTDGGISWEKFTHTNQDKPMGANWVVGVDVNPYNGEIWAATWKAEGTDEFYGVSASADNGQTWSTFLSGSKANNFGFKFDEVMAATNIGLFRTLDKGTNWIAPASIIDARTGAPIHSNFYISAITEYLPDNKVNIWLGSSGGLAVITEDDNSKVWEGDWNVFKASQPLSSVNETYCAPNPYYPNKNRPLKIVYSTNNKLANVTIRVFDFGMNLVKTIIQNVSRNGNELEEYWDGRDESGTVLPNGVYFYSVVRNDDDPIFNKIMILR